MEVYLAGTMSKDPKTLRWREEAEAWLESHDHYARSPFRKKNLSSISKDGLQYNGIAPSLFCERDLRDIEMADVVLIYTLGIETMDRQSLGTLAELGIAIAWRKPIILVADHPSIIQHPFVLKWVSAVVPTLAEALAIVDWLE
jgi:nucleoside 2-deoxyribosyltransferase